MSADGVITRGDANPAPDPVAVRPDDVVGVAVLDLGPVSGLLATGEREGRGARLVTGVLAAAVVVRELTRIAGRRRVTPTARASAGPADHAAGSGVRPWPPSSAW